MPYELGPFRAIPLDEPLLECLIAEHEAVRLPRLQRLWSYYRNALAESSERTVRPLCLAYFGPVWLLSAWCELRQDFRTFRLDRIDGFAVEELEATAKLHLLLQGQRVRALTAEQVADIRKRYPAG